MTYSRSLGDLSYEIAVSLRVSPVLEGIYYNDLLAAFILDSLCCIANWMRKCLFPHLFFSLSPSR